MQLEEATNDDVECIVFSEDRFGYVTPGKIYEVKRRGLRCWDIDCGEEIYVIDDLGREYYWFGSARGEYLKVKKVGNT